MHHRATRVAEAVKAEIASLLLLKIQDVRINSATLSVTDVEVTGDLRHATVYISVLGTEEEQKAAMAGLKSATGFIRTAVGQAIKLRATPELHWKLDASLERGARLNALMGQLAEERAVRGEIPEGSDAPAKAPEGEAPKADAPEAEG